VCFTLGLGLFLKFLLLPGSELLSWTTLLGFSNFCIIFTGMYESRSFDLDMAVEVAQTIDAQGVPRNTSRRKAIEHHRWSAEELQDAGQSPRRDTEGPITLIDQGESTTYMTYHSIGVLCFLFITCIVHTLNCITIGWKHVNIWQLSAWKCSLVSIACGMAFLWLNGVLQYSRPADVAFPTAASEVPRAVMEVAAIAPSHATSPLLAHADNGSRRALSVRQQEGGRFTHPSSNSETARTPTCTERLWDRLLHHEWLSGVATRPWHRCVGALCILIELSAMLLAATGGLIYRP